MNLGRPITRRSWLRQASLAAAAGTIPQALAAKPDPNAAAQIESLALDFMKQFGVPGLSIAFSAKGRPAFSHAYGLADDAAGEELTTSHRFRIASISKPITSVAIFKLIESGKLKLDDPVFGGDHLTLPPDAAKPEKLAAVTVHHLLSHTSGGWRNDRTDPMFSHPRLPHDELIPLTLREVPLTHDPGTHHAYSNFGYCLLGRLIEKISGTSYAEFTTRSVLAPCGIRSMQIAGDTRDDRAENEVAYHGRNGENPYNMNVRRMDAHGGWIATPGDLLKFLLRADGEPNPPDLLAGPLMKAMLRTPPASPHYAGGWSINQAPNWWHGGSLPGTATIAARTARGLCWAGFTNARAPNISGALDHLMWKMAKAVPEWGA